MSANLTANDGQKAGNENETFECHFSSLEVQCALPNPVLGKWFLHSGFYIYLVLVDFNVLVVWAVLHVA